MALVFSLSIECGPTRSLADAVASHFADYLAIDHRGAIHRCHTDIFELDGWWASVWPEGVSNRGITCDDDSFQMNAIASGFYAMLRAAPPFRFALAGIESDGFRTYLEIDQDFVNLGFDGLVISREIWLQLGSPGIYTPFAGEHMWRVFRGVR